MRTLIFSAMALALQASMLTPTRFIDFENGNDAADGLTPATAWQHDPGDPLATGQADAHVIGPGDVFAFKGGVRYRSRIVMGAAGTSAARVVRVGNYPGFGTGRAIYDGAEPVTTVRLPTSQADAGGIADWAASDIRIVEFPERPHGMTVALFDGAGLLHQAQSPAPLDRYLYDDIQANDEVAFLLAVTDWDTAPKIDSSALAILLAGQTDTAQVGVWVNNSQMRYRKVASIAGSIITLDAPLDVAPYAPTTRVIIRGDRNALQPGTWAPLSTTKAVVRIRAGDTAIRVGRSLFGSSVYRFLNANNASYHTVRGFRFEAFVGQGPSAGAEAVIRASNGSAVGIEVFDNVFTDFADDAGDLVAVQCTNMSGQLIRRNAFQNMAGAGGVLLTSVGARCIENIFHRISRTPIRVTGDDTPIDLDIEVIGNLVTMIRGVHSNGVSFYNNHRGILFEGNLVFDCTRPLTTQGNTLGPCRRRFRRNVLVTSSMGLGRAFEHNGGSDLAGLDLEANLCIGHGAGFSLRSQVTGLRLVGNFGTNGSSGGGPGEYPGVDIVINASDQRASWQAEGNSAIALDYLETSAAMIEPARCDVLFPDGFRLRNDLRLIAA